MASRCMFKSAYILVFLFCTIPTNYVSEPPSVSLTCDGRQMNVCFSSASYTLETRYLASHPSCLKATTSSISQGVCMEIDMEVCDTSSQQVQLHHCLLAIIVFMPRSLDKLMVSLLCYYNEAYEEQLATG